MAYQHSRYGQCDSFFYEEEDSFHAIQAQKREQARQVARQHQRIMGMQLSQTTADEYQDDILAHMEKMEADTMPDVNSIDIQTEIQWFMRPYLLDFLIEAHMAFQLLPETLFLAVNLLDRYCSRRVVYKRHYQLVGCAALLIAAKYGDKKDRVPTIRELKSMCCQLYDDEMFTQMEWHVLATLDWMIGHPTIDSFLQIALAELEEEREVEHLTQYICEIALFHREFVSVLPSILAKSALTLARCVLNRSTSHQSIWTGSYDQTVVVALSTHLYNPSQVVARKYASGQLSSVSTVVEEFLRKQLQAQAMKQMHAPPTPTLTPVNDQTPDLYHSPHTPQKNHQNAGYGQGAWTPPDTPDDERYAPNDPKIHQLHPQIAYPATPTNEFESMAYSDPFHQTQQHFTAQYVQ
ncbi:hypothetical protein EJ05DRAFT_123004 [Pseudovirgaria hyperparasitica]|uniref:Uncharacterized protein n=1 Tax=Pseudovirgaria hyperparasitica TaxID=470096 RepID=A0A6A6VZ13_9PEZI|nr:uncharacterized protein EJ05DRAFT_123004 [Pseudovirgaria hyperparasitica]KAF2755119.1 hypothetical protein EJ05DRAFT_123004 [Pseudovirgaria hyperparasitica]